MEKNLATLIAAYKQQNSKFVSSFAPKFPRFAPGQDTIAQLMSFYEIYVEKRGGATEWDEKALEGITAVESWMFDEHHRWLFLYGPAGNGKTTMLKALNALIRPSVMYSAQEIVNKYKDCERLIDVPFNTMLLIDDLGAEDEQCKIYGEIRNPLTELLLKRYSWNATTVVATNLTIEDIQKRYGDRVYDRMSEMASAILFDGPSYRRS